MNADKMKTPLLLVHGEADNNQGTFTVQTERYFQALKNLGAPVKMVLLPKEAHGYVAKENILHLLYEQDIFLEKCLKGNTKSSRKGAFNFYMFKIVYSATARNLANGAIRALLIDNTSPSLLTV